VLDHVTLWALLAAVAVAVGLAERQRRRALVAAGGPWPGTERYARTALTLSRIEATLLVRHPLVWLGLAASVATVASVVPGWARPSIGLLSLNVFPLAIGLCAAIHLAVSRNRRAGTDELARTLPTGPRTHTAGLLLAAAWLAIPLGALAVAATLAALGADRSLHGTGILPGTPPGLAMTWTPGVLELVQPALVVLIAAAVAVAAGRWWPHASAAFLVPLLLFSPVGFNAHAVPLHLPAGPRRDPTTSGFLGHVSTTQLTWHLIFLGGYLTLATAGALAHQDRRPAVLAACAAGLAAMVVGFVIKVPSFAWLA
jgi:hypothetical protein